MHTRTTLVVPSSHLILTFWRLGLNLLGVCLLEWLTFFPATGSLPQISHRLAILCSSLLISVFPHLHKQITLLVLKGAVLISRNLAVIHFSIIY